jgi:hypothetical protein
MNISVVEYRRSLASFLARFAWQYFVTLTWDPKRRPARLSAWRAEKLARVAMCKLGWQIAGRRWKDFEPPVIQYAGVVEYSREGDPHVHLVVMVGRPLNADGIQSFSSWWLKRFGFLYFVPATDIEGLASYLAKAAGPDEQFFISSDLR